MRFEAGQSVYPNTAGVTDGLDARDELTEMLWVGGLTESWRESVLKETEGVIGGLVVVPVLCNTLDDTRGAVMSDEL